MLVCDPLDYLLLSLLHEKKVRLYWILQYEVHLPGRLVRVRLVYVDLLKLNENVGEVQQRLVLYRQVHLYDERLQHVVIVN